MSSLQEQSTTEVREGHADRAVMVAAGAVQGLAFWLLHENWPESYQVRAFAVAALTFLAVASAVSHFCWTGRSLGRLAALAAGVGALYGAVALWVGWQLPRPDETSHGDGTRAITWVCVSLLSLYTLGPFVQIIQATGRLRFPYERLVQHAWSNVFVGLIGGLFVGSLWVVLLLWGEMFDLIGIGVFGRLFRDALFAYCLTGAAVGWGIALGRMSERVVSTLRTVTLSLFRTLLPLTSIVAIMFTAALPITGLGTLWDTNWGSSILLAWTAVTILLLNAVYQDGTSERPYHAGVRGLVEIGLLVLVVFVALAVYGLGLRIAQYGLTPQRIWGCVVAALLGLYVLGYAGAVALRGATWLGGIRRVNVVMAVVVVVVGLAMHTPALDPLRLSASNQLARLRTGRVAADTFDYGFLRFYLGRVGARALDVLERLEHPQSSAIRAGIARARTAKDYGESRPKRRVGFGPEDVMLLSEAAWPVGLFEAVAGALHELEQRRCEDEPVCTIVPIELDGRPGSEFVVHVPRAAWPLLIGFARAEGDSWKEIGRFRSEPREPVPSEELQNAMREKRVGTVSPEFADLMVDGRRFRLSR